MWFILIGLALLGFFAFLANLVTGAVELIKAVIPVIVVLAFVILGIMCITGAF